MANEGMRSLLELLDRKVMVRSLREDFAMPAVVTDARRSYGRDEVFVKILSPGHGSAWIRRDRIAVIEDA